MVTTVNVSEPRSKCHSNHLVVFKEDFALVCDVLIVTLSFSHWYPGSGVVLDFIDS